MCFIIYPLAIYQRQQVSFIVIAGKGRRTSLLSLIKSGFDIFKCRGKSGNLMLCDRAFSWSECHLVALIAVEVYYYLFSEW